MISNYEIGDVYLRDLHWTVNDIIISVAESIKKEWGRFRSSEGETKLTDGKLNII